MHFSFSEIIMVLIVALLVIKPEHLPDAARTLAHFLKWIRKTREKIQSEIEKPLFNDSTPILPDATKQTDKVG